LEWEEKGANCIHVIDLDAAMNEGENLEKIAEILANVTVNVQVGGGIRSAEKGFELLGNGADRVILGTAAFENQEVLHELIEKAGSESVMVALDVKEDQIAVEGWKKDTEKDLIDSAKKFEEMGVGGFLLTNIEVEGKMEGLDPEPSESL